MAIYGSGFQAGATVLFGTIPGGSVFSSPGLLLVTAPAHQAGPVDVTVASGSHAVTLRSAYTFVAVDPPAGPTTPTTAPAGSGGPTPPVTQTPPPTSPTTAPTPSPTTRPPSTTPTTTPAGTTPTTTPSTSPPTTQAPTSTTVAPTAPTRFTFGPVAGTRGTLQLRPVAFPSLLVGYPSSGWSARRCTADPCAAVRL